MDVKSHCVKKRMFEFLDRLIFIALPRVRDFKGLSKNLSMVMVTIQLVLKNKLFFLRLTTIKLIKLEEWILPSLPQPLTKIMPTNY